MSTLALIAFLTCVGLFLVCLVTLLVSLSKMADDPNWTPPYTFQEWLRMFR